MFWPWVRQSFDVVKDAALALYVAPCFAVWLLAGRPGIRTVPGWYAGAAGAFLLWALVRIAGVEDSFPAFVRGGEWLVTFAAAAAVLGLPDRSRRAVLNALFVGAGLAAVIGIAQYLFGWAFMSPFDVDRDTLTFTRERSFSTFGNPIFFAGFLILLVPVTLVELSSCWPDGRAVAEASGRERPGRGWLEALKVSLAAGSALGVAFYLVGGSVKLIPFGPARVVLICAGGGGLATFLFLGLAVREVRPLVLGFIVLLELASLAIASSAGAFLGLAAALVLLAVAVRGVRRWILVLAVLAAAAGAGSALWEPDRISHLRTRLTEGDSGRLLMWRTAFAMWRAAPFAGAGLAQFSHRYPCVQMEVAGPDDVGFGVNAVHAHNEYLEAAAELGLPGLGLLVVALGGLLFLPLAGPAGWAVKAGILAVAVHSLFNFPLHTTPTQAFVWLIAGLALGRAAGAPAAPAGLARPAVAGTIALAAGVAAAMLFVRPLVRSSYLQWALAYQEAKMYGQAERVFGRALRLGADDTHSRLHFHWGKMLFDAGNILGAQEQFARDQARFPCYPEGFGNLGVIFGIRAQNGERGALALAQRLVGEALRRRPGGREAAGDYASLGNLRVLAGDEAGALENYRRALIWDEGNAEAALAAGQLLARAGKRDEAAGILRAALRRRPDHPDLLQLARHLGVGL